MKPSISARFGIKSLPRRRPTRHAPNAIPSLDWLSAHSGFKKGRNDRILRRIKTGSGRRAYAAFDLGYLRHETGGDDFELLRGKLDRRFELLTDRLLGLRELALFRFLHLSFSCRETKG